MGKDREGVFHPPAGRPAGSGVQAEVQTDSSALETQLAIEERYGIDPDTNQIEGAQMRHPNRNADKRTERRVTSGTKASANTANNTGSGDTSTDKWEEINQISREFLDELFHYSGKLCVSIYLPTHRTGTEINEQVDAIAFKTSLQQVQRSTEHLDNQLVARTLAPAYELLKNDSFWRSQNRPGIAFFLSEGYCKYVTLPEAPKKKQLINTSFLVAPLLPYFLTGEHFYLLVISKKQSKLFRGDRYGLTYISVPEMPNGIEDVVHLEEKDDNNLIRSGSSGGGGGAVYHGTGSSRPEDKDNIAMYLAEVDNTIRKDVLRDSNAPLLLAGVGYLIPIFKKVSHYNHIWDKAIIGNYEYDNDATLFTEAIDLMREYFEEPKKKALADYGNKSATELTSHILDDIIRAAYYKRIDTLFVDKQARLFGSFDENNDKLEVHASESTDDDDLIDKTILKTLLSGGKVFMLDESEMPVRRMMVAVMRYVQ